MTTKAPVAVAPTAAWRNQIVGQAARTPRYRLKRDGGRPPVLVEVPERIEIVRAIYRWAAQGLTDGEVASRVGLKKTHVSELLTNPVYGRTR